VLKDWIKAHTKEAPNPHEEPLSIRYLWETSLPHSSSSQRGSQEIQVHRDHRRSGSTTSTYTVSSQGSPGSSVFGFQPNALQSLIATSPCGSGDFSTLSPTQTASVRHPHGNTAASASTRPTAHHAYHATYQPYPSQPHGPGGISSAMNAARHATAQIHPESVPSAYLNVPGVQDTAGQPPVNFVFTNEQGAHFDPSATAAPPLLIPGSWQESSFLEASPVASSLLSPGSPYASSTFSSSSSFDDGSWDQAPPSPSYFSNDLYTEANQSPSTTVVTQNQGMYYQPPSTTYPTR
jgi:hypothetical protein